MESSPEVVERAEKVFIGKPWGRADLRPWADNKDPPSAIGEIWFERPHSGATTSLLLKLLFTSQPLSIQVHPDDSLAQSLGLPNGKTEAWYILSADAESQIGLGLKQATSESDLRAAIVDGSIRELVNWMPVGTGDFIFIPAGTIHAIGAGVVLAEVQQNSDATFRLFDYGRGRELHPELSIAASDRRSGPRHARPKDQGMSYGSRYLLSCPYFKLALIKLAPNACADMRSDRETWVLVLQGAASFQDVVAGTGEAIFLGREIAPVEAGAQGLTALAAYATAEGATDCCKFGLARKHNPPRGFADPANASGIIKDARVLKWEPNA